MTKSVKSIDKLRERERESIICSMTEAPRNRLPDEEPDFGEHDSDFYENPFGHATSKDLFAHLDANDVPANSSLIDKHFDDDPNNWRETQRIRKETERNAADTTSVNLHIRKKLPGSY